MSSHGIQRFSTTKFEGEGQLHRNEKKKKESEKQPDGRNEERILSHSHTKRSRSARKKGIVSVRVEYECGPGGRTMCETFPFAELEEGHELNPV